MKHLLLLLLLPAVTRFFFSDDPGPIRGQWEWKSAPNQKPFHLLMVFREDSIAEGFSDGTLFATGRYYMKGDTLFVADPICSSAYWGSYRLRFYQQDSVLMSLLSDTCTGRAEGLGGRTFTKAAGTGK